MASRGHRVYATARRLDDLAELAERGCRTLSLDVTDEQSMRSAVAAVEEAEGAVGVLVNNAGYSQSGAVETLDLDDVRRQRSGRIVNISSMGGKLTFPGGGAYHATKHAVEAISDALRFEVKGFGVDVVVIEPGLIKTRFGDTARATVSEGDGDGAYAKFNEAVAAATVDAYEGPLSRLGGGPESVARTIEKAVTAKRPRTRYPVTPSAWLFIGQHAVLTDRMWDAVAGTQFPHPK
jgi:NADP-dependent 3-hydroxy acid dehydrogenase YdfG